MKLVKAREIKFCLRPAGDMFFHNDNLYPEYVMKGDEGANFVSLLVRNPEGRTCAIYYQPVAVHVDPKLYQAAAVSHAMQNVPNAAQLLTSPFGRGL